MELSVAYVMNVPALVVFQSQGLQIEYQSTRP